MSQKKLPPKYEWSAEAGSLWLNVLTSSLSGAAVVGTMATKHLISSAVEIADEAVRRTREEFSDSDD